MWTVDLAKVLFKQYGAFYTIKNEKLRFPLIIHLLAPISPRVHSLKTRLGPKVFCDTTASREILGMEYRSVEQALVDMFYSLIKVGIIENRLPKNYERPRL